MKASRLHTVGRAAHVVEVLPTGWSQRKCATCKMLFAFSPLVDPSGVKAKEMLRDELERHVQQNHVDLPSAWRPEDQSQ
jgi:hypothetical protein